MAILRVIEAHEQLHERGLARSCGTHDGNGLTLFHPFGEAQDHRFGWIIAEGHFIEGDIAAYLICKGGLLFEGHLRLVQEREDALGRSSQLLEHVAHLG